MYEALTKGYEQVSVKIMKDVLHLQSLSKRWFRVAENATKMLDCVVLATLYSAVACSWSTKLVFRLCAVKVNLAPLDSVPVAQSPSNPKIISYTLLVETSVAVGTLELVDEATAGSAAFVSQGVVVLAPETPNATIDTSSVAPVSVW